MKGAVRKSRIGYIFQDKNLNDSLTVKENIRLMATLAGEPCDDETLSKLIGLVGMPEKLDDYPKVLSGGEQQRLAVICALETYGPDPAGQVQSTLAQQKGVTTPGYGTHLNGRSRLSSTT